MFLLLPAGLWSQTDDPLHTELQWFTIETEHFFVHFHEGTRRTAAALASIAESVYEPITSMYHHQPDQKVQFVIRDHDDFSNGAAYFYDNKIEIWAPALDYEFRGIHPWLWNVVSHEFTHIVQIQTAMKLGRKFPGVYFQWFGYESERRPDVLYGFPNVLVSYPFSAFVIPSWFAEGTAQYNHPDFHFDYWDSHRDMILRMYMLDGNPLGWEEMAVFGKTSLGNESSYNAGFSIVQYIAEHYGKEKLVEISRSLGSLFRVTIDGAIESALGMDGEELYTEWKEEKEREYRGVKETVEANLVSGPVIEQEGFGNFYPQFSPDGSRIIYVSNKGRDYLSQSSVYLYDRSTGGSSRIIDGVRSSLSFSPDGRFVYYSKVTSDNPHWSRVFDLYRYDLLEEEETRLTEGLRAMNPKVSPDGRKIVFTFGSDGTVNLGVCDSSGANVVKLTHYDNGEQFFTPAWSPDAMSLAAGFSSGDKESVVILKSDGSDMRIVASDGDSRNPCFSADGTTLYFSSDRTGIFNVYSSNLSGGDIRQITNLLGGAFVPSVNRNGDVVYAEYTSTGYKIALLPVGKKALQGLTQPVRQMLPEPRTPEIDHGMVERADTAKPYRNKYTNLSLIPMIRIDNYNPKNKGIDIVKPGLYFTSSDMLDKLSLFGGAAINRKFERDLFFILEYRDRLPLLFSLGLEPVLSFQLFNISRKTTSSFTLDPSPVVITPEITYNLFEVDIAMRHRIFAEGTTLTLWYALSRYSADIGSFVNPNDNTLVAAFRSTYLIGNVFAAEFRHKGILPDVDSEINPVGRSLIIRYAYESNKFNPEGDFSVENGALVPVYTDVLFHRVDAQWDEHTRLFGRHTMNVSIRGAGILGKTVDSFFDFYAGGVLGMKGYPFYALGGNKVVSAGLSYRFPIIQKIDLRILQFYFTKLYGSVFADVGNAWTGTARSGGEWKKDAGFELRLESFSFYAYPTRFFFSGAYGFNKFERVFGGVPVTYGKEWRFYLGVLFGFELSDVARFRSS